jgi:hypothetical protein
LLISQDNKPATFFVGDRFPVTLSLLSGSVGSGLTANPGGAANPFPSTTYNVGAGPVALVAADLENRGLLDLAVVNELDNTVSILLNQGGTQAGTFAQPSTSPISLGAARTGAPAVPPRIASAILNSSGFHDLLITDRQRGTNFLGNGDGTPRKPPARRRRRQRTERHRYRISSLMATSISWCTVLPPATLRFFLETETAAPPRRRILPSRCPAECSIRSPWSKETSTEMGRRTWR